MTTQLYSFIKYLVSFNPGRIAFVFAITIFVGLMEGMGLMLLIPMLYMIGLDLGGGALGKVAEVVSNSFLAFGVQPSIISVLIIYVLLVSLQSFLSGKQSVVNTSLRLDFEVSLRRTLYSAISHSRWLFIAKKRSSDFVHLLMSEVDRVSGATMGIQSMAVQLFMTAIYIVVAINISALVTCLAIIYGILLAFLQRGSLKKSHRVGKGSGLNKKELYSWAIQHIQGMKTAKSYGVEEKNVEIFSRQTEKLVSINKDFSKVMAKTQFRFYSATAAMMGSITYISVELIQLPAASLLLLIFIFGRIMPKFASMQQIAQNILNSLPAYKSIMDMIEECKEETELIKGSEKDAAFNKGLSLTSVSFCYNVEQKVLRNIDIFIEKGKTTAIAGPSGAGKSTVADLIIGLIVPQKGGIMLDNELLTKDLMRSWRSHIGYVEQETFLMNDTLRSNLLWARPDASEEEMIDALKAAAAYNFVLHLPDGIETIIGDRGIRLSGGERQRLSLARALLRKPQMLILDEATSSLDSENENRIMEAIDDLHGKITILIISHRLTTIRNADIIYMLEESKIVESGKWNELTVKDNGRFRDMCVAQGIGIE